DSPLDNANFLSFEEWKRQNLAKVGQSAEHLGARAGADTETRRRPGAINNALDSLGEDAEIEIDFGGFRGKDAGKTCKERSNYASFDCASTVLKSNPECKGSTAVLVENKDSYMLNICSAKNKFFIVELCDDILIDTIVLANFEFFSSMFRTFRVSVSDRYPVKLEKWRELGLFEARNSREVQAFLVENPLIWARYLRVEFLTHFGNEYYCPVSLLRVHGTTMMEEFNHDVKGARNDDDEAGDAEERDLDNQIPSDIVSADASIEPPRTVLSNVPDKGAIQDKSETVRASNQTSASIVRVQSSPTQPAHPIPTTQESFFKSVHKRLQLLESNSTLSLQYIEEQSRILREAFSKVEKRQLVKTTAFLETLNTTVLTELRDFRHQYDQIWQSTVLELSSQREQSQHEVLALSARLSLLADEIVFQKRMAIVQFGFILLCLGLIIFSRH
ncbi:UNC-like C-terminal-domain-containing protein, partial [Usnea florida]